MCDYSLMMIPNRLAMEGEQLVAHKFNSGSTGLVSLLDFTHWQTERPAGLWQRIIDRCFYSRTEPAPVVCIPPGARLRLREIPRRLRDRFDLDLCENATFTQTSADETLHRDALVFANGATVMLQWLLEGQTATVLGLSSAEHSDFDPELARTA